MVTIPAMTIMGVRTRVPAYLARLPSLRLLIVSPSRTEVSVAPGVTRAEVVGG